MPKRFRPKKRFTVSLRMSILSIFVMFILMTTLSIIFIESLNFSRALTYTSFEIMRYAALSVQHQLTAGIRPAALQATLSSHLIEKDVLKVKELRLIPYTFYLLKTMPLAQRAFWADEYGNYIYSNREQDGSITTGIYQRYPLPAKRTIIKRSIQGKVISTRYYTSMNYDPRTTPWYQQAKKNHQFAWTNAHLFHPDAHVGIGAIAPIMDSKKGFDGVFGINIGLNELTEFMTNLQVSAHGFAYIITQQEDLIAYSTHEGFPVNNTYPYKLLNVHKIGLPIIDASLDIFKKTGQTKLDIVHDGIAYLVTYTPIKDMKEYGWLIGVVVPKDDFIGVLEKTNAITFILCLFIMLFGVFIVLNLVSRIVKPIKLLSNEADKIKRFDLSGKKSIHSIIREVDNLSNAMTSMKFGLKSFQKYVPKFLVMQLIKSGEDMRIGGSRKSLVVFFSDIENFTSISEKTDPETLTMQLCHYFDALSTIIVHEKGTIDKYIGDCIMAFWGAPIPEKHVCKHAANAALKCQKKVEELNALWIKEGKPPLITRFGIHTGEAIVGNIGSSERLNYTVLGDTINIASRLEGENKVYHTKIIVSEAVYHQIKDSFVLRMLDHVTIKGKTEGITIYELMGKTNDELPFDIKAYRVSFDQGFEAYQEQQWQNAIQHFETCLTLYPADTLAPIFIQRLCTKQKTTIRGKKK